MDAEIRTLDADAAAFHALRLRALREHPEAFSQSYESQIATPIADVAERLRAASEALHDFILGVFVGGALSGMRAFGASAAPSAATRRRYGASMLRRKRRDAGLADG